MFERFKKQGLLCAAVVYISGCSSTHKLQQSHAKGDGVSSGGSEVATSDLLALECLVSHKRFTAWEWNEGSSFRQLKKLQIFNAYTDSSHGEFVRVNVKFTTDHGVFTLVLSAKAPISRSGLPVDGKFTEPSTAILYLGSHDGEISGEFLDKDNFGPVAIALENCATGPESGSQPPLVKQGPDILSDAALRFKKSELNSDVFTEIALIKNSNETYTINKSTLTGEETFGSAYSCVVDIYRGVTWAVQCTTPDRRPVDGEKKEFIIVSYDGRTFFAVSRLYSPVSEGEIVNISDGLLQL